MREWYGEGERKQVESTEKCRDWSRIEFDANVRVAAGEFWQEAGTGSGEKAYLVLLYPMARPTAIPAVQLLMMSMYR